MPIKIVVDEALDDNRRSLGNVQFPFLIFVGKRDTTTLEATVRVLFDGMKQSKKRFISVDAGHIDAIVS